MIDISRLSCSAETGGVLIFKCPTCKTLSIVHSDFVEIGKGYVIKDDCPSCWAKNPMGVIPTPPTVFTPPMTVRFS